MFDYCREAFIDYWVNGNMLIMDTTTQIFKILKQQNHNFIVKVILIFNGILVS